MKPSDSRQNQRQLLRHLLPQSFGELLFGFRRLPEIVAQFGQLRINFNLAVGAPLGKIRVEKRQPEIPVIVILPRPEQRGPERIQEGRLRPVPRNRLPVSGNAFRFRGDTVVELRRRQRFFAQFRRFVLAVIGPHPQLEFALDQHQFPVGFVGIGAAFDHLDIRTLGHYSAIQRGGAPRKRDVGLGVERHVENRSDGVAHIDRTRKRQHQRAARTDSPGGEGLSEIGLGRVEIPPRRRRIEKPADSDCGVDKEADRLVPRPPPFRPQQTAEQPAGIFQVQAGVVNRLDHRPRQNRGVDPPQGIDHPVHQKVGAGEHRTIEALDRIGTAKRHLDFARSPAAAQNDLFHLHRRRRGNFRGRSGRTAAGDGQSRHRQQKNPPSFHRLVISSSFYGSMSEPALCGIISIQRQKNAPITADTSSK